MGRLRGSIAALIAGALLVLPIAPAQADEEADAVGTEAAREPASVSVPLRLLNGARGGQVALATIRVGRSAPIPVLVDTGFSGLVLFPNAWTTTPRGVALGRTVTKATIASGIKVPALQGQATVTINGIQSVVPVPFAFTTATNPILEQWKRTGARGLIGIGLKGSETMVNPLTTMPGELGLRWSVHLNRTVGSGGARIGSIVMGQPSPADPTMSFQLASMGTDVNGANLWNDQSVNACWKVGVRPERCVPTVFNSLETTMRLRGAAFRGAPVTAQGYLRPGTRVSLAAPTSAFTGWTLAAGAGGSRNLVQVTKWPSSRVSTGNATFFDFTVSFNTVTGRIYLSDPIRKAG